MASLMFSIASSTVSPWLWQPGKAGQWTSYPKSVLFTVTMYFMEPVYYAHALWSIPRQEAAYVPRRQGRMGWGTLFHLVHFMTGPPRGSGGGCWDQPLVFGFGKNSIFRSQFGTPAIFFKVETEIFP